MDRIGRYEIVKELGHGAMGVVYQGIDPNIGRHVAIKTMRLGEVDNPERRAKLRDRLFREARSAGILSHPGIVTIYDMEEEDGLAYIAMEFVDGPTLDDILASGEAVPSDRLFSIMRQAAAALDYAHEKGIVHRDIKPANLIIGEEEQTVKISDFGIAKIESAEDLTMTGTIVGTPNYMSPEQVQGVEVDGATDQFSLAVVAYEMLTGERPFPGEHLTTVVYKIVAEDPIPPQRINPTLGPEIDRVLEKALAKKPHDRYPSCGAFVGALEIACAETKGWHSIARHGSLALPTMMGEEPAIEPPVERPASNRKLLAWAVVLLAVAGAGVWASGWLSRKPTAPPPVPVEAVRMDPRPSPMPLAAPQQPVESVTSAPERTHAQVETTQDVWITTNPPAATATLDGRPDTACQTPCNLRATPGTHSVSISLAGFQTERRQVQVGSGSQGVPPVVLQKETGTLMLSTIPAGASISIDDQALQQVTPAEIRLSPGQHRLVVEKDGMRMSENIEIHNGETNFLKIPLQP